MATSKSPNLNLVDVYPRAVRSTVNKLLAQVRTAGIKEMRKTYNIRAKVLRGFIVSRKARSKLLIANLVIKGARLPVFEFSPTKRKKGISVRIRKDGGRKVIEGTFFADLTSGKRSVFRRRTKKRLPIDMIFSTSAAQMFEQSALKAADEIITKKSGPILENEVRFFESKLKK
jgi:hypothetical protein